MKIPNGDNAVIDQWKLRDYLFSDSHPVGRFKARLFKSRGYAAGDREVLEIGLRGLAADGEAEESRPTELDRKHLVSGMLGARNVVSTRGGEGLDPPSWRC